MEIKWRKPKDEPAFDVYIFVEYEFSPMGGPHYEVGLYEERNRRNRYFEPREGEQRELIEWKYVKRWAYLDEGISNEGAA